MPTPDEIETAMGSAGIGDECPRCERHDWMGATLFVNLRLSSDPGGEQSTDSLPALAVVCQGCGFISLHSPMVLGLA
jgi:hypothetical protein